MGIEISDATKVRRELVNAGLYIRDHALHLIVFVLPDVYNLDSIMDFDENDPVERSMIENLFKLKAAGNMLAIFSGGRAVHAPDMIVGGFSKPVDESKIPELIAKLQAVRPIAVMLAELFAKVNFSMIRSSRYLSLKSETYFDYLFSRTITDSDGRVWPDTEYKSHLQHDVAGYSHASRYRFDGQDFFVGALARVNLNQQNLHPNTRRDLAHLLNIFPSNNVHHNNLAQAIEIVDSIDHALDLIQAGNFTHAAAVAPATTAGTGIGIIEAPRGALYHSAEIENGIITKYEVIVPTGQNQINIENDLRLLIENNLDLDDEALHHECEKLIRAYDPCMSCASHFLKLKLKRS